MSSLSLITLFFILISRKDITTPETINLSYQNRAYQLTASQIDFTYGFNPQIEDGEKYPRLDNIVAVNFDQNKLDYYITSIESQINIDPIESKFEFKNGRVQEFQLSRDGLRVQSNELSGLIINDFVENRTIQNIPVQIVKPKISTDQINNLGVKELIGRGSSTFYHSASSRVHNVALAAKRINGILVGPGETFSFNNALGDVSQFTGYEQAYIISEGKTVLGDGGGVCQVSTTLFRALLNAGLPITERQAHAYRVGYYEQGSPPGLDATVYGPHPDLKFTNDTPGYILIEAVPDIKHYALTFDLYGTSDGRVATISKPTVSDISPAPEPLYQDDPTLPAGELKQIDFAASGAKVSFSYKVVREGKILISRVFSSNYRPWQAVFLRGTGS